ncbi:hypothetical protein J7J50_18360, partial [Lysobacter sp. ISL-50]|uniref:hypothetical protein n=1 Tax=Lysobacter sp. ISL-50 TaxID=2819153 RepID=UPI001BE773FB
GLGGVGDNATKDQTLKADQTRKASAMKRRVTFFVRSHKESNQRKGFRLFRIKSHECDACAGRCHIGHPAQGGTRRTSLCAALRVSFGLASYRRRPATTTATATTMEQWHQGDSVKAKAVEQQQQGNGCRATAAGQQRLGNDSATPAQRQKAEPNQEQWRARSGPKNPPAHTTTHPSPTQRTIPA